VPVSQSSGIHIKQIPQEADQNSVSYSPEARYSFERLTQQSRFNYLAPKPSESGVSLTGALWSATSTSGTLHAMTNGVKSIGTSVHKRFGLLVGL
jgi:chitodextrinase